MLKFSIFLWDLGFICNVLIWLVILFVVGIGVGWVSIGLL